MRFPIGNLSNGSNALEQTTMYKEETAAIAKLFERTALKKYASLNPNPAKLGRSTPQLVLLVGALVIYLGR